MHRKFDRWISTRGVGVVFVCLLALSFVSAAGAEDSITLGRVGHQTNSVLAHAGHEWQGWHVPGERDEGGVSEDMPRGYPSEESERSAAYMAKTNRSDEANMLASYVPKGELSFSMIVFALGSALLLGSTHALSPGHGKTMVAAYLIGSRGTRRDAVLLGGIVTFTHVISVVLLGLLCLLFSKYVVSQKLFPWIGAASGTVIFLVGYWMLAKKALGIEHGHSHHGHHHETEDPHRNPSIGQAQSSFRGETTSIVPIAQHHHRHRPGHDHRHHEVRHDHCSAGHVTTSSLVSLGLAGGMVPCPTALVILLSAISLGWVGFGLLLIIFFSLGLAAVLIVIGLLTVTASRFVDRFSESRKWIQLLPVFSAGAVMIIGIGIAFNSLVAGGILTISR
ncbi:MAG: nickel/cobalt transporter [Desulfomonilaceae bacterium]